MPWLNSFLLGRPGFEVAFDVNPEGMSIDEGPIDIIRRNLQGDLKKSLVKTSAPVIKINSSYLLLATRNQFASLAQIPETFLSFKTRTGDWQTLFEYNLPQSVGSVQIQNTSAFRLDVALAAAGFTANNITINNVYANPGGTGTDFFVGGSYSAATGVISLGTPLPSATSPVFVNYSYSGWLVNLRKMSHRVQGGWLDRFTYDFELTGV